MAFLDWGWIYSEYIIVHTRSWRKYCYMNISNKFTANYGTWRYSDYDDFFLYSSWWRRWGETSQERSTEHWGQSSSLRRSWQWGWNPTPWPRPQEKWRTNNQTQVHSCCCSIISTHTHCINYKPHPVKVSRIIPTILTEIPVDFGILTRLI